MTEPTPLWKRNQELENEVERLKVELAKVKNQLYIVEREKTTTKAAYTKKKGDGELLTNTDDIANWTVVGKSWHNYNNTFRHVNGTIYSYDEVICTVNYEKGSIELTEGSFTKTTKRRQNEVKESFNKYWRNA